FDQQHAVLARKSYVPYFANHFKDILRQCDQHGVDHRLQMNQTPLMAAAAAGNVPLIEALLERGADRDAVDHYGHNALHWALRQAFGDAKFAAGPLAAIYEYLAPPCVDVNAGDRLVRIDRHLSEYFLFQTLWVLFKARFSKIRRNADSAFQTQIILDAWQHLPANVVRPERNKRQHLSGVLARNEIDRDYAYNRSLFLRVATGRYQFNPKLAVRRRQGEEEHWIPIYTALNLPLINEFAYNDGWFSTWDNIDKFLALAGLPKGTTPIAAERFAARQSAKMRELDEQRAKRLVAEANKEEIPRWGTKEAKRLEIERLKQEIEKRKKG
ncbi:MAG TPA: ankyrin repeat domain-containing protein, partial [Anaerolineae bacterium]